MAELSKAIARLMEERSQPPTTPQHRPIYERIRERVAPGERAAAESFSRLLLARATPDFTDRISEDVLAGLCVSAFRFVAAPEEEPRVRVFNPDAEVDGWESTTTVVETLVSDRPFIVDTVREALHQGGGMTRLLLHPILGVERDGQRALTSVAPIERTRKHESFIHAEVDRINDAEVRAALENDLRSRLNDLLVATNDYQAMRQATTVLATDLRTGRGQRPAEPPAEEIAAFLEWLTQGNFVFLGYRAYDLAGEGAEARIGVQSGSGLGLLRRERSAFLESPRIADLDPPLQRRILQGPPIVLTKTSAESPVHRRARMDYVGVRTYDAWGTVTGEKLLLGLLTSRAYTEESAEVPLLRRKLQRILQLEGAVDGSHDYREIVNLFNTMPKEHLLAVTAEELHHDIRTIRDATGDDVRVTVRADQLERGMFVLVVFPRESYSSELRRQVEQLVRKASGGTVLDQHVAMEETDHVRLHFYVAASPDAVRRVRGDALEVQVRELLRTWDDRLRDALEANNRLAEPRALARRYAATFSPEYKAATDVEQAVGDIRSIEALVASGQPQVELINRERRPHTTLKLYLMNEEVVLSDFLPVLENLGLRIFADNPLDVSLGSGGVVHLHAFEIGDDTRSAESGSAAKLELRRLGRRLADALLAHRAGRLVDDSLNRLVLSADLTWQQVQVLRAYANHAVQAGVGSHAAVVSALACNPDSARAIWDYFYARFDPADRRLPRERLSGPLAALENGFVSSLAAVESIVDDRILRAVFATVTATVRTNALQQRDPETIAFKLEAERIAHLPRPRPRFEIFVHGPQLEGVHLRAGKVARGGLRLSDRADDYRTEILDLMRTQVVKNAVIIPTGAKGGFHVRRRGALPPTPGAVSSAYRSFVAALLALTDNVSQGRVVPTPGVLYDEPDTYLVVAADKGTATFSDTANEESERAGFWLGDAFASGGSHGYDHKKIGITARGAWECVRRHFRELNVDADRDPITAVGIGDMSGDVFGNGMLLSRQLRLLAAFNHQHIFLDPTPDHESSFAERSRLFVMARSTWDDYDRAEISPGGGVYLRAAKTIALTPEVKEMLGVQVEAMSGEELVRALLTLKVDLLWNGGIGTYVRASTETDAEVGDSANDSVRVAANELRARVVGEGGNLGFTQAARVEYALAGGRINSDAIDNAGGVNLSDHEVNLKILFGPLVEAGEINAAERNRLLGELENEVTEQVLDTNRSQARALGLDQLRSQGRLAQFLDLIDALEHDGVLDRGVHGLPDKQTARKRRGSYLGLTRPELALVLAHAKLHLQHQLLSSPLPDDPQVERYLHNYFPRPVMERFRHGVRNHRLRREIIAVELVNALVDVMGATFVHRITRDTGQSTAAVVRALVIAGTLAETDALFEQVSALHLPPLVEARIVGVLENALERACKWLLRTHDEAAPIGEALNRHVGPTFELFASVPAVLHAEEQRQFAAETAELAGLGLSEELARKVASRRHLVDFLEIAHLAGEVDAPLRLTAEAFYRSVEVLDLDWVRGALAANAGEDRWEQRAVEGLIEAVVGARRVLTREILTHRGAGSTEGQLDHCLTEYAREHGAQIDEVRSLIDDVKSAPRPSLAALFVIMREVERLCGVGA